MKMITNYLNSFETYLPSDLKDDIRDELESSINEQVEDKKEQLGRDLNDQEQEELLLSIGHPSRVAAAYLPNQQLVGPDLFPAYKKSLQIALMIYLGINLALKLPSMFPSENILVSAISLSWDLLSTATTVFSVVTIIFYMMQKYEANIDKIYAWSPKDIKESSPKLSINRLNTFFELTVQLLFLVWWNGLITLPLTMSDNSMFTTASFSMEWTAVFMPVNIITGLGIIINIHKLVLAGWNYVSLISNMLLNIAILYTVFYISGFTEFMTFDNPELIEQNILNLTKVINLSIKIILGGIAVAAIYDIWSNAKWLRKERVR